MAIPRVRLSQLPRETNLLQLRPAQDQSRFTATGLVFIATKDEGKLRAYDDESGKVLWETDLPAASEGVPAVYEVDGREYLVLCAASAKQTDIPRDGPEEQPAQPVHRSYIAFALPKDRAAN